jgi:DNA invertase Pin-like site-specific DNA recombinase
MATPHRRFLPHIIQICAPQWTDEDSPTTSIPNLSQFERRLIQERTRAGLAAARARGKIGGRKPLHPDEPRVRMAYTMYTDQRLTVPDICRTLRISPATFYRYVTLGRRAAEAM